jgi:hypothetical protein
MFMKNNTTIKFTINNEVSVHRGLTERVRREIIRKGDNLFFSFSFLAKIFINVVSDGIQNSNDNPNTTNKSERTYDKMTKGISFSSNFGHNRREIVLEKNS